MAHDLELAVSSESARVWVGLAPEQSRPGPIITLGFEHYPSRAVRAIAEGEGHNAIAVLDMTPGQTRHLIAKLQEALALATPEGT